MQEQSIPALILGAAERFASASAIEDGEVELSFNALADASLAAARSFIARGIESGDRVAIWAPNIHGWIIAAVGLQMAGGVLVPLSTRFKGAEAGYILRKSRARLLCTVSDFLDTNYLDLLKSETLPHLEGTIVLRGAASGGTAWSDFLAGGSEVSLERARERALGVSGDDLSDILFTSGTTGKPKGVMTTHAQTLRTFDVWSRVVGIREGDRYLVINPFFHSFGYKAGWVSSILRGATCVPHLVFDADAVLARIEPERISVLPGPPAIYQSMLANPNLAKYDTSCLRLAVTGAAPVPVELVHRMREELGFETVVTAYGLTETCGVVSICLPDDDAETISTTSGCAIPDVEVRCVDPEGAEVARGEPGEVLVRGYNVMRGYFEEEEETNTTIDADGWLHTGDIAIMNERGYLTITDRIKDMFIMGGFNCYPAEIESLLFGSGLVAQAAVIGIPDERMGEVGMAFAVPAPGKQVSADEIVEWCRANMANYKVPRRVQIVAELPTNASGKVTKFVLREEAQKLLAR
ncbi:MAG: AMP-binding protein [bacterium]|nr:AMP-binding protein [bacterium]